MNYSMEKKNQKPKKESINAVARIGDKVFIVRRKKIVYQGVVKR